MGSLSIQTKTERQTIMKHSALCLVDTEIQADAIVGKLRSAGFSDNDISVLFPDKGSTREFAHKKETKMPEGATVGASAGGALGGTIGYGIKGIATDSTENAPHTGAFANLLLPTSHQRNPGRTEVQSRHCCAEFYTTDDLDVNEQALSFQV
jgi:hypothetical protein